MKNKDKKIFKTFADEMLDAIRSGQIDTILSNDNQLLKIQLEKTEEALRKSEIKYRSIFENVNDAIFFLDSTKFIDCNNKTIQLFGCQDKKEFIGHHPWEFSPEFQSDGVSSKVKAKKYIDAAFKGESQKFEWLNRKKDGTLFTTEVTLSPVKIVKNTYLLAVVRDITERVIFTKKLKESEELFRNVIENLNDAIYLLYDNKFELINSKFTKITGYTLEEVNRNDFHFMQLVAPRSMRIIKERERKQIAGEEIPSLYEFYVLSKDGKEIPCEASVSYINYKDGIAALGVLRDISERKKVEDEIKKLSMAIKQSPAIVEITDKNEVIEYVNPVLLSITGYDKEELLGKTPRIFKSGLTNPDVYKEMWNHLRQGEIWQGRLINKKKSGEIYYESAQIAPILDEDGEIIHYVKVSQDITKMIEYEQSLIEAKEKAEAADKLKSEFLAQISHEIRTPLNILLNYSSLVEEEIKGKLSKNMEFIINGMRDAGERIVRTVDLVINMSELQAGSYTPHPTKIDLCDIVMPLVEEFLSIANRKNLKLTYNDKCSDCSIVADEYSTKKIIENILDNAVKYTEKGEIVVTTFEKDKYLCVSIKDTGIGVDKKYLPRIFEPFTQEEQGYTRRYEGNGLGLALVKKYCELNNALIQVESEKGKGSTFTVMFPKYQNV